MDHTAALAEFAGALQKVRTDLARHLAGLWTLNEIAARACCESGLANLVVPGNAPKSGMNAKCAERSESGSEERREGANDGHKRARLGT